MHLVLNAKQILNATDLILYSLYSYIGLLLHCHFG